MNPPLRRLDLKFFNFVSTCKRYTEVGKSLLQHIKPQGVLEEHPKLDTKSSYERVKQLDARPDLLMISRKAEPFLSKAKHQVMRESLNEKHKYIDVYSSGVKAMY